jgi:hypothetical protein
MTDIEIVDNLFTHTEYMVIAVVLPDGKPWAVPVHIANHEGHAIFEWDSKSQAVHSKALETNPNIAITAFYMNTGFYAHAKVKMVQGAPDSMGRNRYRAEVERCWLNYEFVKREVPLQ